MVKRNNNRRRRQRRGANRVERHVLTLSGTTSNTSAALTHFLYPNDARGKTALISSVWMEFYADPTNGTDVPVQSPVQLLIYGPDGISALSSPSVCSQMQRSKLRLKNSRATDWQTITTDEDTNTPSMFAIASESRVRYTGQLTYITKPNSVLNEPVTSSPPLQTFTLHTNNPSLEGFETLNHM